MKSRSAPCSRSRTRDASVPPGRPQRRRLLPPPRLPPNSSISFLPSSLFGSGRISGERKERFLRKGERVCFVIRAWRRFGRAGCTLREVCACEWVSPAVSDVEGKWNYLIFSVIFRSIHHKYIRCGLWCGAWCHIWVVMVWFLFGDFAILFSY